MALTPEQRARYARNLAVPGFGEEGQERLARARVCVIGLGGLGSAAASYLASAGVGTLGLVDSDVVEVSNLQRQILHSTPGIGMPKTESAAKTLSALNPEVRLKLHAMRVTPGNVDTLLASYDAVVEATDRFEVKFQLNDACLRMRKPFATAGVAGLTGQALFVVPGRTPCLRCAVPETPEHAPTAAEAGILGAAAGVLGCIEALDMIRWLAGLMPVAEGVGLLHSLCGETMRLRTLRIPVRPGCLCAA